MDGSGGQSVSDFTVIKGTNEKIVKLIADRLEVGQKKYKQEMQFEDGRNMIRETLEELLDACVYLSTELLKLEERVGKYSNDGYMRDY